MANGLVQQAGPKKISVPLTKIVIGAGLGLVQLAAIASDRAAMRNPTKITAAQNFVPIIFLIAGVGLSLAKNASARAIGNDIAVVSGAFAVLFLSKALTLGNGLRGGMFGSRGISLRRGAGAVMQQRTNPMSYGGSAASFSALG